MNKLFSKAKVKSKENKVMLDNKIHHSEEQLQKLVGQENPFVVPDHYFEHVTSQIISKTKYVRFLYPWQKALELLSYVLVAGGALTGSYFLLRSYSHPKPKEAIQSTIVLQQNNVMHAPPKIMINDARNNPVVLILPDQHNTTKTHVVINPQATPAKIIESIQQLPLPDDQKNYILHEWEENAKDYNKTANLTPVTSNPTQDQLTPSSQDQQSYDEFAMFEQLTLDTCIENPIRLSAAIPGGMSYQWNTGDTSRSIFVRESGTYRVTVTLRNGNAQIKSIRVRYIPKPQRSTPALIKGCVGEPITLNIQQQSTFYSYEWPQLGSKEPTVEVISPGWYFGYIKGCKTYVDSFFVKLSHCDVFIPNAFTPNGDGINDYFYIGNIEKYPGTELKVYNRFNALVFHSTNYQNEWNGENCEDGTYLYILKFSDGIIQEGTVTIRR